MANSLLIGGPNDGIICDIDLHSTLTYLPNRYVTTYYYEGFDISKPITLTEYRYKFTTKIDDLYIYEYIDNV